MLAHRVERQSDVDGLGGAELLVLLLVAGEDQLVKLERVRERRQTRRHQLSLRAHLHCNATHHTQCRHNNNAGLGRLSPPNH